MIKYIANLISEYLETNNSSLTKYDLLKIQYSLQVILGELFKFTILLLIFFSLNEVPLFLFSFVILLSIRPFLGGIHCKTFNSCLIFSIIHFMIVLSFSKICSKLDIQVYIVFFIISFIVALAFAPCRNEKRPLKNKVILKILSLISLIFWGALFFKLSNIQICNCIFVSILLQIIQVIIINMKGDFFNAKTYKLFIRHTD